MKYLMYGLVNYTKSQSGILMTSTMNESNNNSKISTYFTNYQIIYYRIHKNRTRARQMFYIQTIIMQWKNVEKKLRFSIIININKKNGGKYNSV